MLINIVNKYIANDLLRVSAHVFCVDIGFTPHRYYNRGNYATMNKDVVVLQGLIERIKRK